MSDRLCEAWRGCRLYKGCRERQNRWLNVEARPLRRRDRIFVAVAVNAMKTPSAVTNEYLTTIMRLPTISLQVNN